MDIRMQKRKLKIINISSSNISTTIHTYIPHAHIFILGIATLHVFGGVPPTHYAQGFYVGVFFGFANPPLEVI